METLTLSQLFENDIFLAGIAFTITIQLCGIAFDVLYAFVRRQWQREAEMFCQLRREGAVTEPCRCRRCPASRFCRFYDKTPYLRP